MKLRYKRIGPRTEGSEVVRQKHGRQEGVKLYRKKREEVSAKKDYLKSQRNVN